MTSIPSFIRGGIRFTCVDCGQCCTGAPGVVRMTEAEVEALATHLGETPDATKARYLSPLEDRSADIRSAHRPASRWKLNEQANGDCIFFDGRCTIYPVSPTQCRTYPFWFKNLRSDEAWRKTAHECPGIGQGRLYTEEDLLSLVHEDLATSRVPIAGTHDDDDPRW